MVTQLELEVEESLLLIRSTVNISGNTIFAGNSATDGGGVCVEFNSMVNIQRNAVVYSWIIIFISGNTTFIGNTARIRGGGVLTIDT